VHLLVQCCDFRGLHIAHSLAFVCAFFRIGSILVAFMTLPVIFSLPLMNSFCAFALPEMSFAKSTSESLRVTVQ